LFPFLQKDEDDSVYDFFERRFGRDIAEFLIDPLIRGVTAGDARNISSKFMFRQLYHYEQTYGSVVLGTIMNRLRKQQSLVDLTYRIPGHERIGFSALACTAAQQKWAQWTLEGGLEELPRALARRLKDEGVEIRMQCGVKTIKFGETRNVPGDHVEVNYLRAPTMGPDGAVVTGAAEEVLHCDHVISTIPAWRFSKILRKSKPSHPSLWQLLNLISAVDVVVINVLFKGRLDILKEEAFGFLVPSSEARNTPTVAGLLGIVFDTCGRAQGDDTVLTIMAQPSATLLDVLSSAGSTCVNVNAVRPLVSQYLKATLGVDAEPDHCQVTFAEDCIPQYCVGHYEKVEGVRMFSKAAKLPLLVAGASYDGISVNDCVYSGRKAAEELPYGDLL
jgi:protoporphyrinogen/coproporphyrinogen III oxidase